MPNPKKLMALAEEFNKSPALIIHQRLETLRVNFFVFGRNYSELKKILTAVNHPKNVLRLWDMKNREQLNTITDEVTRLVHNYLEAAMMLRDHTRVMIREWYRGTPFKQEYEDEKSSRFVNNPVIGFVEGLRNFTFHYSLPFTTANLSVNFETDRSGVADFTFTLNKLSLLQWSNWPQKSKSYLDAADEKIDIVDLVDDYYKQINDFHEWLHKRLKEVHAKELVWLEEMKKNILNEMSDEEKRDRGLI